MIVNYITDKNNSFFLKRIEKLDNGLKLKYGSGNFERNIVHYLDYKCNVANINIFFGYINNLLIDYSNNNIFIFDKSTYCQNWNNQLHNYKLICTTSYDDTIISISINRTIYVLDYSNPDINIFYKSVMKLCRQINSIKIPNINNTLNEEDLPYVSVCMPTYNRRKFIDLIHLNYNNCTYPQDKLEFIILDDGSDSIQDVVPKNKNVRYYYQKEKKNIGWKRNECVRLSKYDIIAFIDDDDYYYPNSLINRIGYLLKSNKDCIFCSTIGCFHIYKLSSIINVTPITYPLEKKVCEASLTFKKSFWHDNKFNNDDKINEGEYFVKNNITKCKEISYEGIIVQLLHTYNTIDKNVELIERNGSYFNFSDEDFEIITNI